MNVTLQAILVTAALLFFVLTFILVGKKHLELKYNLLWLTGDALLLIVAMFPKIVTYLARLLNIVEPVNALFLVILFVVILIIFAYNIILCHQSRKIRNLIQEVSILKAKVENRDV